MYVSPIVRAALARAESDQEAHAAIARRVAAARQATSLSALPYARAQAERLSRIVRDFPICPAPDRRSIPNV